jgi:hypothetical protein
VLQYVQTLSHILAFLFSFHLSDVDECEEIKWSGKRIVFTFFPWDILSLGAPFVLLVIAAVVTD